LEPFRGQEGLSTLDDSEVKSVVTLLWGKGRVRELVASVLVEDVEWSDITVGVALGFEIGETTDEVVSDSEELAFSVIDLTSLSAFEVSLEVVVKGFDEDGDLVIGGAEVVLVFRGVAEDGDDVGVLNVDSFAVESKVTFESLLSVANDVLDDVLLRSSLVLDNLDFTVVSVEGFSLDDLNLGTEVGRGGGRKLAGGGR
jgi:hypothetical protein